MISYENIVPTLNFHKEYMEWLIVSTTLFGLVWFILIRNGALVLVGCVLL